MKMKRALLVGVDDYMGTNMDLKCAKNDIEFWANILMDHFEFPKQEIRLLYNHRATKEGVTRRLNWLKSGVSPGDTIVFFFSGHGTTFTERDWDGRLDEEKDEGLCLTGYDLLIDDDLNNIFSNISREVNLTVICDSCYSGGMSDKYTPAPPDIAFRSDSASGTRRFGERLTTSLLVAACKEDQQAVQGTTDTGELSLFSYYATKVILSYKENREILTASQFIKQVAKDINDAGFDQVPQLKGREDLFEKPLFECISFN
jgi:hypothetical protein